MESFADFGLDRRLTKAVAKMGFAQPTPVQEAAIPLALEGRDLLVRARTGSGKTAAYALPLVQKLLVGAQDGGGVAALVLVPTRELAEQTLRALRRVAHFCGESVRPLSLSGAAKPAAEAAALRDEPNVVVGTPARVLLHVNSGALSLEAVETLVVDEADMVLAFGHEGDVSALVDALPQTPQAFLVSATLSAELDALKRAVLHSPTVLELQEDEADGRLAQFYVNVPRDDRDLLVYALLTLKLVTGKILFFVNSVEACYRLKLLLEQFSVRAAVLNAELPANSREHALQQFNRGIFDILIATDGALSQMGDSGESSAKRSKKADGSFGVARGVDFVGVAFVVNYDMPRSADDYTHRVGRTARGMEHGTAITLVDPDSEAEQALLAEIQGSQPALPAAAGNPEHGAALEEAAAAAAVSAAAASGEDGAGAGERPQPEHLQLDMREVENFRYRVSDVRRVVTRLAVREARLAEVRQELTNSARLATHFDDNPRDLQVLRHDRVARPAAVQPHLAHVPTYLLPPGVRHERERQERKRRRGGAKRQAGKGADGARNRQADPLQSFSTKPRRNKSDGAATFYTDDVGSSTSRRQKWKASHNKGQYRR